MADVLVVIFDDPSQKVDNTVILAFGAQDPAGRHFRNKTCRTSRQK